MKILMVCLGNICRSPLAEGVLQEKAKKAGLNWVIDSAGTNGFHDGEHPHHLSQKVARANGIDISRQISRRFTKNDIDNYDKIYIMAADVAVEMKTILSGKPTADKVVYFLDCLYPGQNRDVPDPWYGDEDGYHEVYTLIEKNCDAIIEKHMATVNQTESI